MNCPQCQSSRIIKDGIVKGKQRYLCKDCQYRHTVQQRWNACPKEVKRLALTMYMEGLGFNSIGRILKVSHVAVMNWIRFYGEQLKALQSSEPMKITEMDEMHTYIGHKKTTDGYGLLLIDAGKDTWTSLWAGATPTRGKSSGIKSKKTVKATS